MHESIEFPDSAAWSGDCFPSASTSTIAAKDASAAVLHASNGRRLNALFGLKAAHGYWASPAASAWWRVALPLPAWEGRPGGREATLLRLPPCDCGVSGGGTSPFRIVKHRGLDSLRTEAWSPRPYLGLTHLSVRLENSDELRRIHERVGRCPAERWPVEFWR